MSPFSEQNSPASLLQLVTSLKCSSHFRLPEGTLVETVTWNGGSAPAQVPLVPSVPLLVAPGIPESTSLSHCQANTLCKNPTPDSFKESSHMGWNIRRGGGMMRWSLGLLYCVSISQRCSWAVVGGCCVVTLRPALTRTLYFVESSLVTLFVFLS